MAGNVLGKGYLAGLGMTIGTGVRPHRGKGGARAHAARDARRRRRSAQMADLQRLPLLRGLLRVFPAMERRLSFNEADMNYLANLCHNCAECYYACQYAPPHEFAVNVPQVLAQIRAQSYRKYAWPRFTE